MFLFIVYYYTFGDLSLWTAVEWDHEFPAVHFGVVYINLTKIKRLAYTVHVTPIMLSKVI